MRLPRIVCLLFWCAAACGPRPIPPSNPTPNLDLPKVDASIGLQIGDKVADTVAAYHAHGGTGVEVQQFRSTLTNAFLNAFEDVFTATYKGGGDFVIEIVSAKPDFIKAAVNGDGGTVAVRAIVEYQARLKVGEVVVARTSGRVTAPDAITSFGTDGSRNLGSAVAVMYEVMFMELFTQYRDSQAERAANEAAPTKPSEQASEAQAFCCDSVQGAVGLSCKLTEKGQLAACMDNGKSVLRCEQFSGNSERIECANKP